MKQVERNEVWAWCVGLGAIGFAAACFDHLDSDTAIKPGTIIGVITGVITGAGAFNLAGWAMVGWRLGRLVAPGPAGWWLVLGGLGFGLCCALPFPPFLALSLAILGAALIRADGVTRQGREAGWLILLLAMAWGAPFAKPVHLIMARIDAIIVGTLAHLIDAQAVVMGNMVGDAKFRIEIFTSCASTTPLPQVALAYLVVVLYQGRRFGRRDWKFLGFSWLFSMALSEMRLVLMVPSADDWIWWHFGPGVTIYQLVALAGAVAFPAWAGMRRARSGPALTVQA